jgi:hypothetical protein
LLLLLLFCLLELVAVDPADSLSLLGLPAAVRRALYQNLKGLPSKPMFWRTLRSMYLHRHRHHNTPKAND